MKTNLKLKTQNSKLRNFKIYNSQGGLTLVEVLVALTILAIGLLGVAMMQITSISGNTFSREMTVATELGQDMLEKLSTLEYTNTALAAGNHPNASDVSAGFAPATDTDGVLCNSSNNIIDERGLWPARATALGTTAGPLLYTRTWTVTDDYPVSGMKSIEVIVCWKEKGRVERSVTITGVKVQ
jgi:type IV pilus assembly protein PilV